MTIHIKAQMPEHYPILIVDDHPVNRKVLGYLLENLGLEYRSACDGLEAINLFESDTFGAILMDIMMPGMDGYEATRRIRKAEFATGTHTPIIACTALDLDRAKESCLAAGMDDLILKPVSLDVLRDRLERWLRLPVAALLAEFKQNLEESMNTNDPVNKERLRLLYGTDQIEDVLSMFVTATEALMLEMKMEIGEKHSERVARLAHELKGSSFAISADAISVLARKMQHAAEQNDWGQALDLYIQLSTTFADLRSSVIRANTIIHH
jgi:CheY-like chemotaxis protein